MAVAVHQNDRLGERDRLLAKRRAQIGIAARLALWIARERRKLGVDIRLLQDHDRTAVGGLGVREAVAQPDEVGAVALGEFGVAIGGAPETIVAADDVHGEEGDAAEIPADVLPVFSEL